jgi:hypothetical protein
MSTAHWIHRHVDDRGYTASCSCGWRTVRRTRELRDQAIEQHHAERGQ